MTYNINYQMKASRSTSREWSWTNWEYTLWYCCRSTYHKPFWLFIYIYIYLNLMNISINILMTPSRFWDLVSVPGTYPQESNSISSYWFVDLQLAHTEPEYPWTDWSLIGSWRARINKTHNSLYKVHPMGWLRWITAPTSFHKISTLIKSMLLFWMA